MQKADKDGERERREKENMEEKDRGLVSAAYQPKEEIPFIRRPGDQIMCWLVASKPVPACVPACVTA